MTQEFIDQFETLKEEYLLTCDKEHEYDNLTTQYADTKMTLENFLVWLKTKGVKVP